MCQNQTSGWFRTCLSQTGAKPTTGLGPVGPLLEPCCAPLASPALSQILVYHRCETLFCPIARPSSGADLDVEALGHPRGQGKSVFIIHSALEAQKVRFLCFSLAFPDKSKNLPDPGRNLHISYHTAEPWQLIC